MPRIPLYRPTTRNPRCRSNGSYPGEEWRKAKLWSRQKVAMRAFGGGDGDAPGTQGVVIHRRLLGEVEAGHLDPPEFFEGFPGLAAVELVREGVEDLHQHQVRHQQGRAAEQGVEMVRLRCGGAPEVVEPDGGVNEKLHRALPGSRRGPRPTPACPATPA